MLLYQLVNMGMRHIYFCCQMPDVTGDIFYAFGLAHNIVKNILVYVLPCRIFPFRLSLMYSDLLVSNYSIAQANSQKAQWRYTQCKEDSAMVLEWCVCVSLNNLQNFDTRRSELDCGWKFFRLRNFDTVMKAIKLKSIFYFVNETLTFNYS